MSATSEKLAEELREVDELIANAKVQLFDTTELEVKRRRLVEQLQKANDDLVEGKNLLKG
jgi:hypothetical protein